MMNLAEYRNRTARPRRLRALGGLVSEGVVLNKDGSLQRTARFRGPDLDSATPAELVGTTARLNNVLRRLGSGWAIFVEAQSGSRRNLYPHSTVSRSCLSAGRYRTARAVRGRRRPFREPVFLTFVWLPPPEDASRAESWLYEGKSQTGIDPHEFLHGFVDRTDRILQLVEGFVPEADLAR